MNKNKIVQYNKIKTVLINGKKKCIYMKPRGTREYVRHNKEFILLNRYLKLISKKLKKQKGGVLSCLGSNCFSFKSNKSKPPPPHYEITADLGFDQNGKVVVYPDQNHQRKPSVSYLADHDKLDITNRVWKGNNLSAWLNISKITANIKQPRVKETTRKLNLQIGLTEQLQKIDISQHVHNAHIQINRQQILDKSLASGWGIQLSYQTLKKYEKQYDLHDGVFNIPPLEPLELKYYFVNLKDLSLEPYCPTKEQQIKEEETVYKQNFYYINGNIYFGVILNKNSSVTDDSYVKILAPDWLQPHYNPSALLFIFPDQTKNTAKRRPQPQSQRLPQPQPQQQSQQQSTQTYV